ncbi:MAG: hypothetical protein WC187_04955 [Bacillota bacterium]
MGDKLLTNEQKIAFLNNKTEELSNMQEQELVMDYDEALREYQEENKPYKIKFKGRVFDVPRSMPFSFGLFYMRHCIKKVKGKTVFEIPDDRMSEFIEKMFGAEFLEMLDQSADIEMHFVISKLIPDIMNNWGYTVSQSKNK